MEVIQNQIYCIIPFYSDHQISPGARWIPDRPSIDHDALYPFVLESSRTVRIYALDFAADPDLRKFWQQTSFISLNNSEQTGMVLNLLNDNSRSWRTPRLVLSESGCQGMLILPMTISPIAKSESYVTSADMCQIVNIIQKYDSGQTPVMTYRIKGNVTILQDNLDTSLKLCYKSQPHTWTLGSLSEMLLSPCGEGITMFKRNRCHVVTYMLGDPEGNDYPDAYMDDFVRITHCQNARYHILSENRDKGIMRTFENIFTGVSVEGACVMTLLCHDNGDKFIRSYSTGEFQSRMLWLYVTLLLQRHVLLDIDRRLALSASGLGDPDPMTTMMFRKAVADTCALRLTGVFASVSGYSQHNSLYRFISDNLHVTSLYHELDEKLRAIDTWLSIVEQQREEVAVRQREKFQHFIQTGSVLLAVMALLYGIPQSIPALHDTWSRSLWSWSLICGLPALGCLIWLIIMKNRMHK